MFIWDYSAFLAVLVFVLLALVFTLRAFYTFNRQDTAREAIMGYFRWCRYCGYVYMDYRKKMPCPCPRCASLADEE